MRISICPDTITMMKSECMVRIQIILEPPLLKFSHALTGSGEPKHV